MTLRHQHSDVEVNVHGTRVVVQFPRWDSLNDHSIDCACQRLTEHGQHKHQDEIVLDLSNVDYLTGAALGKLVTLDKDLRANGATLVLLNPRPIVEESLAVTRLNTVFDVRTGSRALAYWESLAG